MKNGPYILVVAPEDYPGKKYRGRYVYEHQLVWWQNTGEIVPKGFLIHHKDEDKHHNKFKNLELMCKKKHGQLHAKAPKQMKFKCAWCGKYFERLARVLKRQIKKAYQGKVCCSRSCQGKWSHKIRR